MSEEMPSKIFTDVLGTAAVAEAVKIVAQGGVDAASAFLKGVCLPAAEEFGLGLKDRVSEWRRQNAVRIAVKASGKVPSDLLETGKLSAHPRLIMKALDEGSWTDSDEVQEMWAGLLASSCGTDPDESNLIFINLLSQLTAQQVKIVKFTCEKSQKCALREATELISNSSLVVPCKVLMDITGDKDLNVLDRELDHLRTLGLIYSGIVFGDRRKEDEELVANIGASALAFNLYVRAQGFAGRPVDYFKDQLVEGRILIPSRRFL
jgi:hypothetical protein